MPNGKFIALENGTGLRINRWVRKYLLKRFYVKNLLYSPYVEQILQDTFSNVDAQYFYVIAHLTPYPQLLAKLESRILKANAENCFLVGVICDKK